MPFHFLALWKEAELYLFSPSLSNILLIALAIGIMFDNKFLVKGMLIGSLIGGLIGSIVMEKMMAGDGIIALARLSYWLLLGIGLMTFTWCINFKDSYHGTRHA